jgi:hypothetical protein
VKSSVTEYIMDKLKLKVNESKSRTWMGYELNFLIDCILTKGEIGLIKYTEPRLKEKIVEITKRY